jgi:hypothetical protein
MMMMMVMMMMIMIIIIIMMMIMWSTQIGAEGSDEGVTRVAAGELCGRYMPGTEFQIGRNKVSVVMRVKMMMMR